MKKNICKKFVINISNNSEFAMQNHENQGRYHIWNVYNRFIRGFLILIISIILLLFGIINKGYKFVKNTASIICMDCIGIN